MRHEQNLPHPSSVAIAATLSLSMVFSPLALYSGTTEGIADYRALEGTGNNQSRPYLGTTDSLLIRSTYTAYGDGKTSPRGVFDDDTDNGIYEIEFQNFLPSARTVSNNVHDQDGYDLPSARGLNQLVFQFGQFLSHDTGLSEPKASFVPDDDLGTEGNEEFNVEVVAGDPDFNFSEISLRRTISISWGKSGTGYREQINTITAFIDGSNVYGSDDERAHALRTFSGGKLKTQAGPDGDLLPYNTFGLENASSFPVPPETLFAAGDVRANEQVGLIAFHTLFVREHNRLADEILATEFPAADPDDTDVDEEIYQRARAYVAALLQKITYYEWLPAILGYDAVGPYNGYEPWVDPSISNEFSTVAFRIGHTMLPSVYLPTDRFGDEHPLPLQEAFFNPSYIADHGIELILRGQANNAQQEIDRFIVDDVRNFLFGPSFGGLDLASLNIQRGRDHGIPSYNEIRYSFDLGPHGEFHHISSDGGAVYGLIEAYGENGIDHIDPWTGGLCEDHLPGSSFGPLFTAIFQDQFYRLRHGDRFYFENTDIYPEAFIEEIHNTSFRDVIVRNSFLAYEDVNEEVFFLEGYGQDDLEAKSYYTDLTLSRAQFDGYVGYDYYSTNPKAQQVQVKQNPYSWAQSYFEVKNKGFYDDTKVTGASLSKQRLLKYKAFENEYGNRTNVKAALKTGTYAPHIVAYDNRHIEVFVKPKRAHVHRAKRTNYTMYSASSYDPSKADSGRARILFRPRY